MTTHIFGWIFSPEVNKHLAQDSNQAAATEILRLNYDNSTLRSKVAFLESAAITSKTETDQQIAAIQKAALDERTLLLTKIEMLERNLIARENVSQTNTASTHEEYENLDSDRFKDASERSIRTSSEVLRRGSDSRMTEALLGGEHSSGESSTESDKALLLLMKSISNKIDAKLTARKEVATMATQTMVEKTRQEHKRISKERRLPAIRPGP